MTDGLNHGPTKMYLLFCDLKTGGMVYGVLPKEQKKKKKKRNTKWKTGKKSVDIFVLLRNNVSRTYNVIKPIK